MEWIAFTAKLEPVDGGGSIISIDKALLFELGGGKRRIPVHVKLDGYSYRSTIVTMGNDLFFIPVRKEIRDQIAKNVNDTVAVELCVDSEKREVVIPEEIMESFLLLPPTLDYFKDLSYTYQKELVQYVMQAKRMETKNKRMQKVIDWIYELHAKKKR